MKNVLKTLFGSERRDVRNLIKVAFALGKIDENEIEYLSNEVRYLNITDHDTRKGKKAWSKLKGQLPKDPFHVFQLTYQLTRKLMTTNMLTDKKERILAQVISVLQIKAGHVTELIHFLKYNIRYGNSPEDSYARLGYLVH